MASVSSIKGEFDDQFVTVKDEMTTLLVVRHAQSTWNCDRRWQGQADPPLSELGVEQAKTAASKIGAVDAIVASPQQRAQQTAAYISEIVGVGPVQVAEDIRERNIGEWSGLTRDEIDALCPNWSETGQRPTGWEDDETILARVIPALESIHKEFAGGSVLVVSHAGVLGALRRKFANVDEHMANLSGFTATLQHNNVVVNENVELLDSPTPSGFNSYN